MWCNLIEAKDYFCIKKYFNYKLFLKKMIIVIISVLPRANIISKQNGGLHRHVEDNCVVHYSMQCRVVCVEKQEMEKEVNLTVLHEKYNF